MTDDSVTTIGAGEMDVTVEPCGAEIEIGLTDGQEAMYGQLSIEGAEALIAALQAAVNAARGA